MAPGRRGTGGRSSLYDPTGSPRTDPIQVGSIHPYPAYQPTVAAAPTGDFVVAWRHYYEYAYPFPDVRARAEFIVVWQQNADLNGRRFSASGVPLAGPFRLDSLDPSVGADPDSATRSRAATPRLGRSPCREAR